MIYRYAKGRYADVTHPPLFCIASKIISWPQRCSCSAGRSPPRKPTHGLDCAYPHIIHFRGVSFTDRLGTSITSGGSPGLLLLSPLALSPSVNAVVPKGQVLSQALAWARDLVANSPDAVQSTKRGIVLAWQHGNVETATLAHAWATESKRTYKGENIKVRFPISCFASLAAVYVYRSSHRVGSRCTTRARGGGGFFILCFCERK